jgi:hypothetical protein
MGGWLRGSVGEYVGWEEEGERRCVVSLFVGVCYAMHRWALIDSLTHSITHPLTHLLCIPYVSGSIY